MSRKLAISFFVHSIRSDWNNGNAHFLRGLVRALGYSDRNVTMQQHKVTVFEPEQNWSIENLFAEGEKGKTSVEQFAKTYPEVRLQLYQLNREQLRSRLLEEDIVVVHEWNPPELIEMLLALRDELGFHVLFHDTHHRASSSPDQIKLLQVPRFDGVIAFGEALRRIYRDHFGITRVWTLHEAADTTIFYPRDAPKVNDVVWIGNWGDNERSKEIKQFLVYPATHLRDRQFSIYGVRYPREGLEALAQAGIQFCGYLPNLEAPMAYASARLTVHVPRQQYTGAMAGIPTIRVFEALASGIALISAPWQDSEGLFAPGDITFVATENEMTEAIEYLLSHPAAAWEQAARGLKTVLNRHTCAHRAAQFTDICEEVLSQ